jgi:hypothetical protein
VQRCRSAINDRDGSGYGEAGKKQKKYRCERFHDILRAARVGDAAFVERCSEAQPSTSDSALVSGSVTELLTAVAAAD